MKLRIVTRVLLCNEKKRTLLLVRNKNKSYWYPPGGGWEFAEEKIQEAAKREIEEEVGLKNIILKDIVWVREFQESENQKYLEIFWKALYDEEVDYFHVDTDRDGQIEEIKEFTESELENIKIFPKNIQDKNFWENIFTENKNKKTTFLEL